MTKQTPILINGYPVLRQQTTQFNQITVTWHFKAPLERETLTKRSLLANWLGLSLKYPTLSAFQQRLSYLYGAALDATVEKSGNCHLIHCTLTYANPSLIADETFEEDVWCFLQDTLFQPLFTENERTTALFGREKETLSNRFAMIKEDPGDLALEQVLQTVFQNDTYRYHTIGVKEDIADLTLTDIAETHRKMLTIDEQLITITGDVSLSMISKHLMKFPQGQATTVRPVAFSNIKLTPLGEQRQTHDVIQAKVIIVYQVPRVCSQRDRVLLQLGYYIWAVDSHSRLFNEVREKAQLAYDIYGSLNVTKQLAYAVAGVDEDAVEQALETMKLQQRQMTEDIQLAELELAKTALWHDLQLELDDVESVNDIAFSRQLLPYTMTLAQWQAELGTITPPDITNLMNQWQYKGSFCLTKKEC